MSSFDSIRLGSQPAAQLAKSTPYQLRALVLDYLCHLGYLNTAKAFARDSTVRHLDADGDEIPTNKELAAEMPEYDLRQVELRQEIRAHILSGRVDEATSLLNEHFPTVLSGPVAERTTLPSAEGIRIADAIPYISPTSVEPIHLVLNLRILSFIEACRTIPLPYPVHDPGDTPQQTPIQVDNADPEVSLENQLALLSKAQKLLGLANTLPNARERELYLKELKNVSGLLAYKVPEHSSISKYLTQERREAVADQIHRAILDRTGQPSVSSLELLARHTSTVWSFAHQVGAKPRPGMPIPPTASPTEQKEVETVPPFDLERFLESR